MRRAFLSIIAKQDNPAMEADREGFSRDIVVLSDAREKIKQRLAEMSEGGEA